VSVEQQYADEPVEPTQVIQIELDGRYVVVIDHPLRAHELERISAGLAEWWDSDKKFCILSGAGISFERIETDADHG